MNPKTKVLSLIERTSNLNKSSSKNITANTTASSIVTNDSSPIKRIKKPPSLSISESISKTPTSRSINSTKNSSLNSKFLSDGFNKSSLEFIKNLNFALADLTTSNERLSKKNKEFISEEHKTLKYVKALIDEQKKIVQKEIGTESNENWQVADEQIKIITQEAAQELCLLEKKCEEIERENGELKKILAGLEVTAHASASAKVEVEKEKEKEIKVLGVQQIVDLLASDSGDIAKEVKVIRKAKVGHKYLGEMQRHVDEWITTITKDYHEISKDLCKLLKKNQQKSNKKKSELNSKLSQKHQEKSHLESKLKAHSKAN